MTRRQKCGRNIERGERTFRVAIVVFGPNIKGYPESGAVCQFRHPGIIDPYELTPSINPLNGFGNILLSLGDLDAAEFFVSSAINCAKKDGVDY